MKEIQKAQTEMKQAYHLIKEASGKLIGRNVILLTGKYKGARDV